jgi:hypothetical protein
LGRRLRKGFCRSICSLANLDANSLAFYDRDGYLISWFEIAPEKKCGRLRSRLTSIACEHAGAALP